MLFILTPTPCGIDAMPFNRPAEVAHINSLDHLDAVLGYRLFDHQFEQLAAGFDAAVDFDEELFLEMMEN